MALAEADYLNHSLIDHEVLASVEPVSASGSYRLLMLTAVRVALTLL